MSSIREKVAVVIAKTTNIQRGAAWDFTDLIINTFLEAAAEPDKHGRTWQLVPREATEEMKIAAGPAPDYWAENCYRAMLAACPEFEVGE